MTSSTLFSFGRPHGQWLCVENGPWYMYTHRSGICHFLHDRPRISPWIKSMSSELDIIIHMIASQLPGYCDVISNRLWRHQQNVNRVRHGADVWRSSFLSSFIDSLCRARNKMMHVLSWRTVYKLTRLSLWCSFPSLLRKKLGKWIPKNGPLVST